MSVLVKGIEMPKNCYDCPFIRASVAGDYYCVAGDGIEEDLNKLYERRMSDCPLAEVLLINDIKKLPSAEEESFEWCTDCKEYDQEAHCCHRWSKMIRKTVDEMQVVRCKDCIYADYMDDVKALWCSEGGRGKTVAPNDFCSYGERKEVTE
jgi:hypothetical protein